SWLVFFAGWRTLYPDLIAQSDHVQRPMAEKLRSTLEREVLPRFVAQQRWYAAKGARLERVELLDAAEWGEATQSALIALMRTVGAEAARFLTDVSPFPHIAPLAGYLEYRNSEERYVTTLAMLQGYAVNQGDGWMYTVEFLVWYLEANRSSPGADKGLQQHARFALYMT